MIPTPCVGRARLRGVRERGRRRTRNKVISDRTARVNDAQPNGGETMSEEMLDQLQHAAFMYSFETMNPINGLTADTSREGSPCSIAVVGFALSVYPVTVERGWIERSDAAERSLTALRFFRDSDQSDSPDATGYKGFYYHFLDMDTGTSAWHSELSMIDTALLIVGALTSATYFTTDTADEVALREIADTLYRCVDWRWAQKSH